MRKTAAHIVEEILVKYAENLSPYSTKEPPPVPKVLPSHADQYPQALDPHMRRAKKKRGPAPNPRTTTKPVTPMDTLKLKFARVGLLKGILT